MNRRRASALALTVIVLAGVGLLVTSALQDTLTYYRTPTELATQTVPAGERIRLGGEVVPGSLHSQGGVTWFRLTDGSHEISVVTDGAPAGTFREGQEAVVEGTLGADGVFQAGTVAARHDNEYRITRTPAGPAARSSRFRPLDRGLRSAAPAGDR